MLLRTMAPNKRRHKRNIISRKQFETNQSDFKCRSEDVLDKNDERCQREPEDLSVKGNLVISEKTTTQSHVTNMLTEVAEDISSTSQIEPECNASKSYKTYKSQLQLNTKYLWSNNPVHNEDSEPKETPTLHDSSQDSSQCNPAASLVSTKIDMSEKHHDWFLLDGYIQPPYEKSENSEQFGKQVSLVSRKRSNEELPTRSSKRAKAKNEGNVVQQTQRPSQIPKLSFEFSDDEEVENFMKGKTKSPTIYSCKHCDYSEVNITRMVSHYDNNHPYVRYKPTYIQDPCDQSATFRCLECPVEFLNVPELQRHYMENHPDHPGFHTKSSLLRLVYKCFVCSYTSDKLGDLKTHYMEMHPTYTIGNTLKYCRYASSSSHSCPSEDMKLRFNDSELPGPERKKTEDIRNLSSPKCLTSTFSPGNECHKSTKESASITSATTLQNPSHESLELVTCENISEFPKETKRDETEVLKLNAEPKNQDSKAMKPPGDISKAKQSPTKHHGDSLSNVNSKDLYYCKFCTFSSPCLRSVVGHHNSKHAAQHCSINTKEVISYSSRLKKLQNKIDPVKTSASERRKHVSRIENQLRKMDKASHASVARLNPYSCAESLFYCQICNFGSPSPVGVIMHQVSSHPNRIANLERVNKHTVLIREEIKKSKWINASFSRNLPLPIMCKNEKQVFFCHLCNYKRRTLQQVLYHCSLSHRGVVVTRKEVERYTSMVLRRRRESIQRTKRQKSQGKEVLSTKSDLEKDTAAAKKRQRSLQCCRCPFNTQLVTDLKRHILEKHNSQCSSSDILGKCFRQGNIQAGYHCDLCVFSHTRAEAVYKHFQEQHPDQKITLNYVNTQLHAGPKSLSTKKKKSKGAFLMFHAYQIPLEFEASPSSTDKPRCMKNKGLTREYGYVCEICSQICATPRELNRHCDEAHTHSEVSSGVKCKRGLKVSLSNDLNRYIKSASKSPNCFYTCGLCLKFYLTRKDLGEHYVGEHGTEAFFKYCATLDEGVSDINHLPSSIPDSTATQQNASEACNFASPATEKKLVYKCPNCPYLNASNSGTLAHCRIRHPRLVTRRCKFQMDEVNVADFVNFQTVGMDSFIRGYACGECPQIHVSLKTLRIHYDLEHSHVKPEISKRLGGTDSQPECSRDFVPEAISSPSANNSEMCPSQGLAKVKSDHMECKVCPNLTFDSTQQLISHYNTLHFSDRMYDFIMLASEADGSGLYRCSFCHKQVHGIPQLHHHLDQHRSTEQAVRSADTKVSAVDPPQVEPATQARLPSLQAYLPVLETVEDLAQWSDTPGGTFIAPSSPLSPLIEPSDAEEPELDPEKDPLICKYYVTVEPVETDSQAKEQTEECPISSDEVSDASALDGEAAVTEESLSSEPPNIQQQLSQTSLKSWGHAVSEANWEEGRCGEEKLTCKDYGFMTVLSKTLKTHIETSPTECLSKPNPLKEFHCPFCPSQTENKNDLIDHIISHREECDVPREVQYPKLSRDLLGTFTIAPADNLHLLVLKQEELQPYRCRLCYFDCDQLRDLQAHLTDKHQVIRNHELVSELVVDQQEAGVCRVSDEPWSDTKDHKHENLVVEMLNSKVRSQGEDGLGEDRQQIDDPSGKNMNEEFPLKISVLDLQNKYEKLEGGRGCRTENAKQIEKVEASKEAEVNQLRIGALKQRTLKKSDRNLPLHKKDKDVSGSEFMEVRSTTTSEYKIRLRPKATLPAEETNQDQLLGGKRGLSFLTSSGGHQIISKKTPGSSFSPRRKKPVDNPRKEEGKTGMGTPQEKNQHIDVKNRLSTGTTEVKHFACDLCGRNLMSNHDLQRHISLHGL